MDALSSVSLSWRVLAGILSILVFAQLAHLIVIKYRRGLRDVPGPWLASFSDLDRLWSCARGLQMNYHLRLHERYGRLVRVGPKHVSFSDASLIPLVYNISSKFVKSEFYSLFDIQAPTGQAPTVFSVRDVDVHRTLKRPVANAFSMGTMKALEPMNDDCSAIFLKKLDGLVGKDINLGKWLHWYAFDVISSITFSNRLGFMEQETDVHNIIQAIEGRQVYNSIIGQAPYLHQFLFRNPFVAWLSNFIPAVAILNSSRYIVAFAAQNLQRYRDKEFNTANVADMLDRFKTHKDGGHVMTDTDLLSHAASNIFAGSDTTAASLRAIFYYLCRNPRAHQKLLDEIDEADRRGQLSDPVKFAESQNLRYFQAVVKEGLRMHPAVGLLLERVVPPGGADVGGVWLPAGTVVGMNPWVAARDRATYGEDADEFRPERWLEADESRLRVMDRNFLAFGGGTRTCLGKNISMLEMGKLVPQLLRRFDFELSDPSKEWTLHDYWFVRQTGLICQVIRREK